MAILLDGKAVAEKIAIDLKNEISTFKTKPKLVVIRANNSAASTQYVTIKIKRAEEIGIETELVEFDKDTPQETIIAEIRKHNEHAKTTGILVQLPVFEHLKAHELVNEISPLKDVDGLSAFSLGLLTQEHITFLPAVVQAVEELLFAYQLEVKGKMVTIVGASPWVGKPLSEYFSFLGATVTLCHDKTKDLIEKTISADILISATGVPGLITDSFIKEGAVAIDIGTGLNTKTNKIEGDFDFEKVSRKAGFITPVPGGVGPMTVISLMSQIVLAYDSQHNKE